MTTILLSRPRQDLRREAAFSHVSICADRLIGSVTVLHIARKRQAEGRPPLTPSTTHDEAIARRTNAVDEAWTGFLDAVGLVGARVSDITERLQFCGREHPAAAEACIAELPDRIAAHNEAIRNPQRHRLMKATACGKTTAAPLAPATP